MTRSSLSSEFRKCHVGYDGDVSLLMPQQTSLRYNTYEASKDDTNEMSNS
jgi:hypothetical protein